MRIYLILPLFLSNCFSSNDGWAGGGSIDYFRHAQNIGANIPNLFVSYHLHINNAMIGGDASTCFFLMGGIKGLLGYRFSPGPLEVTPFLTWGYYVFWLNIASGPGVGLILTPKEFPLSIITSLIRHRTKEEPDYTGFWTSIGLAFDF